MFAILARGRIIAKFQIMLLHRVMNLQLTKAWSSVCSKIYLSRILFFRLLFLFFIFLTKLIGKFTIDYVSLLCI